MPLPNPSVRRPGLLGAILSYWLCACIASFGSGRASAGTALSITTSSLPAASAGASYQQTLGATGGALPYKWSLVSGGFPPGLTLHSDGQIVGTATASGSWVYSYPFRVYVRVTDSSGANTAAAFTIPVVPANSSSPPTTSPPPESTPPPTPPPVVAALTIATAALPNVQAGAAFSQSLAATGGQPPYSWKLLSGGFPDGLKLDATGQITGTPSAGGSWIYSYPFQVYIGVTDAAAHSATKSFSMKVLPPAVSLYLLTVVNGSGSGSYAAGTTVSLTANPAPAGQAFQKWNGATVADPLSPSTTLVMPASNQTVTASYGSQASPGPTNIPQPVTGHPRLWLTPADLPRLRGWCVASNPIYQQGLVPLLHKAMVDYDNQFFPGGTPNPNYPDFGDTQGYAGLVSEQYALIFAFHSLIDPDPVARIQYAQRARNLIMVAMNQAAQGALAGAPFRDPLFATYNRANATSEAWPLAVDWIYDATDAAGNPVLTAQDKAVIRTVFLRWANDCLNASTTGGDHPSPVGAVNSPSLLGNGSGNAYRMASNNYYLGHARLVTLMSLAFDPSDDPVLDPSQPASALGNTLRSYILNATGAWLYQEFAMLGDPSVVRSALALGPNASVGLASGGLPPGGMLYGHSYSFLFGQLLALKTAGFADPTLSGPQATLANNPLLCDRFVRGMITSLVPSAQVYPGYAYMGPVYEMASYGDILRLWITPDFAQPFALLALLDKQNGDSSRLNAERWFVVNALEGGAANLLNRVANPWSYGVQDALLTFLLLDPAAPVPTDPRPGYSTVFYDAPQGRLVEHTDWSANASMFDFRCNWISINHQQADAGQFEFYRKGEWLTKGVANYDNNSIGLTTDFHNTLSLQNWCANGTPTNLGWWEGPFWTVGSQWQLGGSAGDPVSSSSSQPAYTYAFGDMTSLYNRPSPWTPANAALDIQHASRSILWLKPDHIVVYDRARSKSPGLFKRFNLALTAAPTVYGNVITTTTPGRQNLFLTVLRPANATVTTTPIGNSLNPIAWLEPSTTRVTIEDPSHPTDTRFLTVLQGADGGTPADSAVLLQSASGTALEGAIIRNAVVLFAVDATTPFTGTAYTVPSSVNQHYITGCSPGAAYNVSVSAGGGNVFVVVTPATSGTLADSAGVLAFSF